MPEAEEKKSFFQKVRNFKKTAKNGKHAKRLFWAWIAYQCIKGALTTSLIWIPLLFAYFNY